MNERKLLVLTDLTKLFEREDGFVIAREGVNLLDETVDLGFCHLAKPLDKFPFQSIPILIYPLRKSEPEMLKDLFYCSIGSGRRRIFAKRESEEKFKLYIRSEKGIAERSFYHDNTSHLNERIPPFQEELDRIVAEYQAACASSRGE